MEHDRVDVVIPVFNGKATIGGALTSVFAQADGLVDRIIVIDDGSTDGTSEYLRSLQLDTIEIVRTNNRGVAAARNLGVERARANWVAFLDADDIWKPEKLKVQVNLAHKHGADFICGAVNDQAVFASKSIDAFTLAQGNFIATSSVLVRRELLLKTMPVFTPAMSFAEDYLAWLKCLTLSRGYYSCETQTTYILSDRPRYNWGQIFYSLMQLNINYGNFLRENRIARGQSWKLRLALLRGSVKSLLSIIKRFANAPRETEK